MPVRLQMKLGVLAETDRLPDSADCITVVEPSIGSIARGKGNLFLLVTGIGGRKLRDATRIVAEAIRSEYYYDESAGISVCLGKAIRVANKRLMHSGERVTGRHGELKPIGIAVAVVRNGELYVATVGPAEAFLVRQARLLTLPDASEVDGLPTADTIDVDVWHGDIAVGDSLVLVSPNVARVVGLSPIQDAAVTLHPQAAVDQLHRIFAAGGGAGSDGILAIEAAQVAATHKTKPLKPVWAPDPLAGTPNRSPIPLADTVSDGVAAVQTSAREARTAARGAARRALDRVLDAMPRRPTSRGRVTPFMLKRERQRRLAFAVIGLCLLIALVGLFVFASAGPPGTAQLDRQQRAAKAYEAAAKDVDETSGQGRNLLETNPNQAGKNLRDAYDKIDEAARNGYPEDQLTPLRAKVIAGLNRYFDVVYVKPSVAVSFGQDQLGSIVLGADGAAYVIDRTNGSVYRLDLATMARTEIARKGVQVLGGIVGTPRLLATGKPDVLILDDHNSLFRWRPIVTDKARSGTLIRLPVEGSDAWSGDVRALGTWVTNAEAGLYTLYVVDPATKNIKKYPARNDGSGYSGGGPSYLSVDQNVSDVDDMLIDGSVYLAEGGQVVRYDSGQTAKGWALKAPDDQFLRTGAPRYQRISSPATPDSETLYVWDSQNKRVLAFQKSNGAFIEQYMPAASATAFASVGGMFVLPGPPGGSATLFWTEGGNVMTAVLNPQAVTPQPSVSPTPQACGSRPPAKSGATQAPGPVCTPAPSKSSAPH